MTQQQWHDLAEFGFLALLHRRPHNEKSLLTALDMLVGLEYLDLPAFLAATKAAGCYRVAIDHSQPDAATTYYITEDGERRYRELLAFYDNMTVIHGYHRLSSPH